jgi:hypothetical protein
MEGSRIDRIYAALVYMYLAWLPLFEGDRAKPKVDVLRRDFQTVSFGLRQMLTSGDAQSGVAASWALAWMGRGRVSQGPPDPAMILSLYHLWRKLESKDLARYAAWALGSQRLLARGTFSNEVWGDSDDLLREAVTSEDHWLFPIRFGAFVVAWYRRSPWNDLELAEQISRAAKTQSVGEPTIRELLENLGDAGRKVLEERELKPA